MGTNALATVQPPAIDTPAPAYADAITALTYGLSASSERQYQHTLALWAAICQATGTNPQAMTASNVIAFLWGMGQAGGRR